MGTSAGAAGNDSFTGFEAVRGSASSDSILGSTDNDNITGGLGNDTLVGGAGTSDYVLYVNATGSVTVDLLNRVSFGADGKIAWSALKRLSAAPSTTACAVMTAIIRCPVALAMTR